MAEMTLDEKQVRLEELAELEIRQGLTPALEAEAETLGEEIEDAVDAQRLARAEQLPQSEEVRAYVAMKRDQIRRHREQYSPEFHMHHSPASLPVGLPMAAARESRPAAGRTRGSRRSTTRSSSSSDDPGGDPDGPARGRQRSTGAE